MKKRKSPAQALAKTTPRFDTQKRELWVGHTLVKKFLQPAAAQETIVQAFQELDWQDIIDDPLPRVDAVNPKHRLHDAIQNLNRNQRGHVLHFFGDGSGKRVGWELRATPELQQ